MKEELQKVLDEILESCIDLKLDPELLYPHLQIKKYLSNDEVGLILAEKTPTAKLLKLFSTLKSKGDDLFPFLQKYFSQNSQTDLLLLIQTKLEECGNQNLIWQGSKEINASQAHNTLKAACDNLKVHYKKRLEYVESYWRQFGVTGTLNMDTFYNHNIVISNEKYKQIQKKIKNFDDIFSTEYERIIVMAEAGYGKSTFVHEMARQWAKGGKDWTRKFEFLFLFRLAEVNEEESKSLENLLSACLCPYDATIVYNWLKCGNMSKALFIFDGLDELRQNFCKEIKDVIFGGKVNLETVVITSRQCDKLEDIKKRMQPKLHIELKGYTEEGVIQQLKKFSIPVNGMKKDLKNQLKMPLFNTIYCITYTESSLVCTNTCSSIDNFVKFAINRYRNSNQSFTESCGEELLLTLGQAAQNKFSFVRMNSPSSFIKKILSFKKYRIPYPNVSRDHLFWAVNSGLLHNSSLKENLIFTHQTIAEYCAAYFWCKTSSLAIKECNSFLRTVILNEPSNAEIDYQQPFCRFVCYLCAQFKQDLWRKFEQNVPIFDEYESLPDKLHTCSGLTFSSSHSVDDQITIMNKLHFQENSDLSLCNGQFQPEILFKIIRNLKGIVLWNCTFNVGAEESFIHIHNCYYVHKRNGDCNFLGLNIVYDELVSDESNLPCPPHLHLEYLGISNCLGGIETFFSFIMKHSTYMKSFHLFDYSILDHGTSWISELRNNKCLCLSIESCGLSFSNKLTKLQANSLSDLLKVGLFGLKYIYLNIKIENQEDYEPILKNLSKCSALTHLKLWNGTCGIFAIDTLKYLVDIFNKLKLEECELEYQEIFFEEQIINSINSCLSLNYITFYMKEMENSSFELFKERIGNKDYIVINNYQIRH